ncbi:hypothetical protein FQR65_LT09632 [Abscondita terminalis]|nr:hypothetical protein FQR65_LT09632 [Abscondita terminalis]
MGQKYYIYNPEYPKFYNPGTSCRWVGETTPNAVIVVTCEDINLPPSTNCQQDRLVISASGDTKFKDVHNYCGSGSMSTISKGNRIAIGLFASWFTTGGRFLCTIAAIQSNNSNEVNQPSKCDCGWRQQRRIVGGVDTGVNEFPLMAALIHLVKRDLTCGASIIANRYALTAAHCVLGEAIKTFAILVGDHNLNSGTDTASAALYLLQEVIAHPDYNLTSRENDIAVVKTKKQYHLVVTLDHKILGWGTLEFTGPRPDVLQKVELTVLPNNKCQEELKDTKIFNSALCTYGDGKDACQFDSGGPILWYDNNTRRLQLVGVISYGIGCGGGFPSVNTRVTSYLAWIITVTSDADYCIK